MIHVNMFNICSLGLQYVLVVLCCVGTFKIVNLVFFL